jgi:hypothetical protein
LGLRVADEFQLDGLRSEWFGERILLARKHVLVIGDEEPDFPLYVFGQVWVDLHFIDVEGDRRYCLCAVQFFQPGPKCTLANVALQTANLVATMVV